MAKDNSYLVFVVDDDTKVLTMSKHYIEKNSAYEVEVMTFVSGEEALAKIDMKPDIIVLDYYFDADDPSALNGIQVQDKVKQASPETEVIMISGQDNMEVALETIRKGAYDYIIKGENAITRAQLAAEKVLQAKNREYVLHQNNKNLRLVVIIMAVFIVGLIAFVLYATSGQM